MTPDWSSSRRHATADLRYMELDFKGITKKKKKSNALIMAIHVVPHDHSSLSCNNVNSCCRIYFREPRAESPTADRNQTFRIFSTLFEQVMKTLLIRSTF